MTRAWIAVVVLLALVAGVGAWTERPQEAFAQTKQVAAKKKSNDKKSVTIQHCKIKLIDQVELAAARSGILAFVEPREGDPVRAEQTVAKLQDEVVVAQLKTAQQQADNDVSIRYAQEKKKFAEVDLAKLEFANKRNANTIPDINIEEKRLGVTQAALSIEQARWENEVSKLKVKETSAALKQFSVIAPIDGIVTKVHKSKGEAVREGDTILEITNTHRLRVEGHLHYKDAWKVKQGDVVSVNLEVDGDAFEAAGTIFKGRIKFVDVEVAAIAEDVLIWAEVENTDNILRAGLQATMVIDLSPSKKQRAAAR